MDSKNQLNLFYLIKKSKKGKKLKFVTKKQEKRLENVEEKKNRERALYHKIEEFKDSLSTDDSITINLS